MRKLYITLGALGVLLIFFIVGVYKGYDVVNNDNMDCRMDVYDSSNTITIVLDICGVQNMSELTDEEQSRCRSEAASSTQIAIEKARIESALNECDKVTEDKFSNPFLLYPAIIFDFFYNLY